MKTNVIKLLLENNANPDVVVDGKRPIDVLRHEDSESDSQEAIQEYENTKNLLLNPPPLVSIKEEADTVGEEPGCEDDTCDDNSEEGISAHGTDGNSDGSCSCRVPGKQDGAKRPLWLFFELLGF
jgi:hypothetical protein